MFILRFAFLNNVRAGLNHLANRGVVFIQVKRRYFVRMAATGWENKLGFFNVQGVKIPTRVSAFPHEIYTAPPSWAETAYPKLVYYKKHDVAGHFAAWEQPQLFSEDVRASFRSVQKERA